MTNVDSDDDDDDETQAENVALGSRSANTSRSTRTTTPSSCAAPVPAACCVPSPAEELVEDTVNTYVAYGEVGQFGALRIDESLDEADAGENTLHVANVSPAGSLDVYLTDANTDLDDTTPVLSGVGAALSTRDRRTAAPSACASPPAAIPPTSGSTSPISSSPIVASAR